MEKGIAMNKSTIFSLGIFLRILVYFSFSNGFATYYFYPFVESVGMNIDPWREWIQGGGKVDAFPYGLTLLILVKTIYELEQIFVFFIPFLPDAIIFVGFLILLDVAIYKIIRKRDSLKVATIYFLSPITFYVSFFYLQTDAIVGFFILMAATALIERKTIVSGIFLGVAIGCKYGVLLVVPFMVAFALANKRFRGTIIRTLLLSLPIALLNYIPAIWSASFRTMVLQTAEAGQIFAMGIELENLTLFVFPAIYLLMLTWIWRSGRTNLKVLAGFIGTSLFVLSITSSSAIGWHLWGLPILILLSNWEKLEILLAFFALQTLIVVRDISSGNPNKFGMNLENQFLLNVSFTISVILGFTWVLSNLSKLVKKSDTLRLNERPVLISIAGDSGVGKDTLTETLVDIFGKESVTCLSGDSYHKYERGNKRWKAKTHLNPEQNRLDAWRSNIDNALKRDQILKTEYDHSVGRFTPMFVVKPNDFIVSQGLHALDNQISGLADVKIFMELDETTRMQFKMSRDTLKRRRSIDSLKGEVRKRKKDYENYVLPQSLNADLIFEQHGSGRLRKSEISFLIIKTKNVIFADSLISRLIPFIPNITSRISAQQILEVRIDEVDLVSSESIYSLLEKNARSFDEIGISREVLKNGALGIMSAVILLLLEFKRGVLDGSKNYE